MNNPEQAQATRVLSSPAGVPPWDTLPKTWEGQQGVPTVGKGQRGRAGLQCVLTGPDSVPLGWWSSPWQKRKGEREEIRVGGIEEGQEGQRHGCGTVCCSFSPGL